MVKLIEIDELNNGVSNPDSRTAIDGCIEQINASLRENVDFGYTYVQLYITDLQLGEICRILDGAGYKYTFSQISNYRPPKEYDPFGFYNFTITFGEVKTFHCDNCQVQLLGVEPAPNRYQFDNALWVTVHGGYGMFIDEWCPGNKPEEERNFPKVAGEVVLCHDCAHKMCEVFPAFNNLISPFKSHTHRTEYKQENPNHPGPDMSQS